jgi:hypothetical protein
MSIHIEGMARSDDDLGSRACSRWPSSPVLSYQICGRIGTMPQDGNAFPAVLRELVDRMVGWCRVNRCNSC